MHEREYLTHEEREVVEMLQDIMRWGHNYLRNRDGSPRTYWEHQMEDLKCNSRHIIHMDGRDVGKTVCLVTDILYYAFTTAGGTGLIAAPHQGQIDTILDEFEYQLYANPDLKASIALNTRGQEKIKRKPYYQITFTSNTTLHFHPAGPKGEAFRSLHVDRLWVDEAAWLTERAWKALRQCVNAGGHIKIYSTPNGLRDSTYYRLTQSKEWKQFHWPSMMNPNWSDEREKELVEFYGGKDSAGWQHEVCGEHGAPTYGVFNLDRFNSSRRVLQEYRCVKITSEAISDCGDEFSIRNRLDSLLNLRQMDGVYYVGGDLGYSSDPTEITVWEEFDGIFHSGNLVTDFNRYQPKQNAEIKKVLKLVLRIHMEHISYPIISEVIALVDKFYRPRAIGIDNGGNGGAVVQELNTLDKFRKRNFKKRLYGFDFGSNTTVGGGNDGKPEKVNTKEFMTRLIIEALESRQVVFPRQDLDVEKEFTTHTYSLSDGRVRFSKGSDHLVDSARCAFLARYKSQSDDDFGGLEVITDIPTPLITDPVFW